MEGSTLLIQERLAPCAFVAGGLGGAISVTIGGAELTLDEVERIVIRYVQYSQGRMAIR
jgi:hypothetical protein